MKAFGIMERKQRWEQRRRCEVQTVEQIHGSTPMTGKRIPGVLLKRRTEVIGYGFHKTNGNIREQRFTIMTTS